VAGPHFVIEYLPWWNIILDEIFVVISNTSSMCVGVCHGAPLVEN
jgi:hypothetical protein